MAIYHFSAKIISRARGSSAVAAAAYRSASRLHDARLERDHDFTNKAGVIHSEVLAPADAPERWADRETLWNEVEAGERRKDAQLAREIEFAIPRELNPSEGVELARSFVEKEFVDRGMVADLNLHWDVGADGQPKPHAHVMLGLRSVGEDGFGPKVRDWNRTELLEHWRGAWSDHVNERLAELGIDARIDHRTLDDQGIRLEPQHKIGAAAARRGVLGEDAERIADHRDIAHRNGERIIAEPELAISAITHHQATFTTQDLARFVHRHTDGKDQFDWAMAAVSASPELVRLGRDGRGADRFTGREMLGVEQAMARSAEGLSGRSSFPVSRSVVDRASEPSASRSFALSSEQQCAVDHVTRPEALAIVVGYAGSGKSAMLGAAREAWEAEGYRVRGATLSGIAAENLAAGSGIKSQTLASLEHGWSRGRDPLERGDVLVVDEAGLVGSRQMERVLSGAQAAGAKVVLVGDAEQLQAIEAGAAFRALAERHGAAEVRDIRRQGVDWQKAATQQLATGRASEALEAYGAQGFVHEHASRPDAAMATVEGWHERRQANPGHSQLMLAYTRADVEELNKLARTRLKEAGELGEEHQVATERGRRDFAAGDRVIFLRNERSLGVRNGTLGNVERASSSGLAVRLDDGRSVEFAARDYAAIDHGYATTIHKSQGSTVDHTHILASRHMDRHAAYVGLSRHRQTATLNYGRDDFASDAELRSSLSRERSKDTTLDYDGASLQPAGRDLDRSARGPNPLLPQGEGWRTNKERERDRSR